uniref:CDP-diacylglycerol--serine O-phosphatidyltransferase n=1 Tax=Candidatus Aschnera chinzeii TaxID=1485666 RepID=A0AAT9G573_9ENTR|nr:MAG: CDP-diacylglycerol--serine O-phosphatidyltransferase [Candidatus Aschnera chinzeii]
MFFFKINKIEHHQYLDKLPKISQSPCDVVCIYKAKSFREIISQHILTAKKYIYITVLYFECDYTGKNILDLLYKAKLARPSLDIKIFVDWHRARRTRIGASNNITNANWYYQCSQTYPNFNIPIFGVPINTQEALGVFHFKGFIFDNIIIYSGASINNAYFQNGNNYRYDRYHLFHNTNLAGIMKDFIDKHLLTSPAVQRLDQKNFFYKKSIKNSIKKLRHNLKNYNYQFTNDASNEELSIIPLIGLGKNNNFNKTIIHLMNCTKNKIIISTPYFNLPNILKRVIKKLLLNGKTIEIITGDKIANDFYIDPNKPFKIISVLPYIYEINLRKFIQTYQMYIDNNQLIVRIWKNGNNTYHVKGIWIDNNWQLITGNNFNPRAWRLDLENAILFHDPQELFQITKNKELEYINSSTVILKHYSELDNINVYPKKVKKLIQNLHLIRIDKLMHYIM